MGDGSNIKILLTVGIIINLIIIITVGIIFFDITNGEDEPQIPETNFQTTATENGEIIINHTGGDQINTEKLIIEIEGQEYHGEEYTTTNTLEETDRIGPFETQEQTVQEPIIKYDDSEQTHTIHERENTIDTTITAEKFSITNTTTNSPTTAGDELEITTTIENTGNLEGTQDVEIQVTNNETIIDTHNTTLTLDQNQTEQLQHVVETTEENNNTVYNITISTADQTENISAEIESPEETTFEANIKNIDEKSEGQDIETTVEITNVTETIQEETTTIHIENQNTGELLKEEQLTHELEPNETINETIIINTQQGDNGSYTGIAQTDESIDTTTFEIIEPPQFLIEINDTNSPITAGDELEITTTIENTGDETGTQQINLQTEQFNTSENITLDGGESTTETITIDTQQQDDGTYELTTSTVNDTDSTEVQINSPPQYEVNITETNSPIQATETASFTFEVKNTGDIPDEQLIQYDIATVDTGSIWVSLDGGESTTETITIDTEENDQGEHVTTVQSNDGSDTDVFTINQPPDATFDVQIPEHETPDKVITDDNVEIPVEITNKAQADTTTVTVRGFDDSTSKEITLDEDESIRKTFTLNTNNTTTDQVYTIAAETHNTINRTEIEVFPKTFDITGQITDEENGGPAENATVILYALEEEEVIDQVETDSNGSFTITDIEQNKESSLSLQVNYTDEEDQVRTTNKLLGRNIWEQDQLNVQIDV